MPVKNKYIVLFVEGDTELAFYTALINYYKETSATQIITPKIKNVKGIGRFEGKIISTLKANIIPTNDISNIIVFCCFDTDEFELAKKPPTDWVRVEKKIKELQIKEFYKIMAKSMIEDWFLKDIEGLCSYLKIPIPKRLEGVGALKKIQSLFKRGNKIYIKGLDGKFIPFLNMDFIRNAFSEELSSLEKAISFTTKKPVKGKKINNNRRKKFKK